MPKLPEIHQNLCFLLIKLPTHKTPRVDIWRRMHGMDNLTAKCSSSRNSSDTVAELGEISILPESAPFNFSAARIALARVLLRSTDPGVSGD